MCSTIVYLGVPTWYISTLACMKCSRPTSLDMILSISVLYSSPGFSLISMLSSSTVEKHHPTIRESNVGILQLKSDNNRYISTIIHHINRLSLILCLCSSSFSLLKK